VTAPLDDFPGMIRYHLEQHVNAVELDSGVYLEAEDIREVR